ncbi:MAG: helix-turn-helix domain-containing protein [Lachnospiraceae bacterium]
MVDTAELRGIIAKNNKTQTDVAKMLGITPKTFYLRMKNGVFGSDEIQIMIDELQIKNPMDVFFAK